jgi:hypothetical protein
MSAPASEMTPRVPRTPPLPRPYSCFNPAEMSCESRGDREVKAILARRDHTSTLQCYFDYTYQVLSED